MDEPIRLLDQGDDFERALLEAGASDRGSVHAQEQAVAALEHALVAPVPATPFGLGLKALSLSLSAAVVVGTIALLARPPAEAPSAPPAPLQSVPSDSSDVGPTEPPSAAPAVPPVEVPEPLEREPAALQEAPVKRARREPPLSAPALRRPTLAEEVQLLQGVRQALARGDVPRALAELDRHAHDFPVGALAMEADVLRVQALLAKGDRPAAEALGARMLERNADGAHARRVRSLLSAPRSNP